MPDLEIGYAILYSVLILGAFTFAGILAWLDYKKSQEQKDRQPDPWLRSVFVGVIILATLVMVEIFVEEGFFKKWWWVALLMFALTLIIQFIMAKKLTPKPFPVVYKKMLDDLEEYFDATQYSDVTNFHPFNLYVTTAEPGRPYVGNFLVELKISDQVVFWYKIDKLNLEVLRIEVAPKPLTVEEVEKFGFPSSKDEFAEAFFDKDEDEKDKDK